MYDLIIKNVRILDGTGAPWYRGAVAVEKEKRRKLSMARISTFRLVLSIFIATVMPHFLCILQQKAVFYRV